MHSFKILETENKVPERMGRKRSIDERLKRVGQKETGREREIDRQKWKIKIEIKIETY